MRPIALCLVLVGSVAGAQEGLRESDLRLSKAALTDFLAGNVLHFYNDGLASYFADGRYEFRYQVGDSAHSGVYEVREDSSVCTVFDNGFERCDYFVQAGERHVMVIYNGDRYPVKERVAIE